MSGVLKYNAPRRENIDEVRQVCCQENREGNPVLNKEV